MTAIIRTEKLTKSYGSHRGIVDVDLEVQQGEVFGFLGPNGAGKTTTIRTMLDLIRPTSGKAFIFDIESSADPAAIHRRIGYLPGEFALYDRLTGGQTLEYFGNLRGGVDRAYRAQLIERFDLDPSRRYREYSKGNKQKVGLVAALQHRPELLLLDEPTAGLDPLVQQTFFSLLREAVADGGTVFLSSHILSEVEKSCARVAIIREGRIAQIGSVESLRDLAHHQVELLDQRGLVGAIDAPAQVAEVLERLSSGEPVVEGEFARQIPDPSVDRHRIDRRLDAEDEGFARGRSDEVQHRPDRRRLAGAVGPEKAEDLALFDLEVDIDDPAVAAVGLGELLELDNGGHERSFQANQKRRVGRSAISNDPAGSPRTRSMASL